MTSNTQLRLCSSLLILASTLLPGCASISPATNTHPSAAQNRITELSHEIHRLGEVVDAGEAQRAARIAIEYSHQLAQEYEISSSSPIMHNFLVNIGVKPRGLCVDWTSDLLARLRRERFYSLDLHWGIANYETAFGLEHSTVIISADGATLYDGLVLDPWRYSGHLFWASTPADPEYQWRPQAEIHALKRKRKLASENRYYVR